MGVESSVKRDIVAACWMTRHNGVGIRGIERRGKCSGTGVSRDEVRGSGQLKHESMRRERGGKAKLAPVMFRPTSRNLDAR